MNGPLAFFLATALACTTATIGVFLIGVRSAIDAALAWSLFASTTVAGTLLVAGAVFHDLVPWLTIVINAFVAALLACVWFASGHRIQSFRSLSGARIRAVVLELRGDLWLSALLAVVIGQILWRVVIAFVMPPYANDALWYHLTTVAGWLQEERIGPSSLTIWSTVYPHTGELLFAWPALLLGDDRLVDAVQLPFAVIGAIAVAGIGRTGGLSRRGAAAAGCLFLLTPIVLSQTTANYNDLIFIAFFLVSFHFLLRFLTFLRESGWSGRHLRPLLLAGLAAGLALGTKWLGLVYVAVLLAVLVVNLLAVRVGKRARGTAVAQALIVFVAPLLVVGSYHYIETWIRFGNPIHPVHVAVFGYEIFAGRANEWFLTPPPATGSWWREVWGQWHADHFFLTHPRFHAYSYAGLPSGLGPLWSYLGLPAVVVYAVRLARANRPLLLNLMLPVAAMFALQPYRWWSRFTIILAAVGAVAIVAVIEALPRRWSAAAKGLVAVLVALGIGFPTLKIDGEFWADEIVSAARLPSAERTVGRVALPGYRWLDRTPENATIGVDTSADFEGGQPFILAYPLFGPRLDRRVYSVSKPTETELRRVLGRRRIEFVFVRRASRLDRWIRRAAEAGCACLLYDGHVYAGQDGRAYRLVPGCNWMRPDGDEPAALGEPRATR